MFFLIQQPPHPGYYQQQQQYYQNQPAYSNTQPNYHPQQQHHHQQQQQQQQMTHNTQSLQNLNLNQTYSPNQHPPNYQQQNNYQNNNNTPTSPGYLKNPPIAPKPLRKPDDPPELPPTSTHPLYSASSQDPPKMAFYPGGMAPSKTQTPRDPWAREEQERQAEMRREQARQRQEQQIRELLSLSHRTPQQEEQLRVWQLEREFQRRALEAAEQDDDDTEKVCIKYNCFPCM